ncbi:MAG: murein hydrolase activator EnvC family protein [Chitinophagales bacterium]
MTKDKNKRTLLEKLRYKYRLIVINEDTFEQKTSLRLSRINIYTILSVAVVILTILIVGMIAFTPVKYFLPGVGSLNIRGQLTELEVKSDSLQIELENRNHWVSNFQGVLTGDIDSLFAYKTSEMSVDLDSIDLTYVSEEEQALRDEMQNVEFFAEANTTDTEAGTGVSLLAPIEGVIIQEFSLAEEHLGIHITGEKDASIKAVSGGTVISADWNPSTGYVIAIQHGNNMLSFYKHNSQLLKKVGSFVEKGEAIAIIGDSGELTSEPYLLFELWQEGQPIDPLSYFYLEKLNP